MKSFLTLLFSAIFISLAQAQTAANPREFEMKEGDTVYVMKQYIMVLLKRGDRAGEFTEAQLEELQAGHMANINRLSEIGKLVVAGPFGDDTALRGIFILDCESVQEATDLVNTDPMIQAGRLEAEYHPWWTAKGTVFK